MARTAGELGSALDAEGEMSFVDAASQGSRIGTLLLVPIMREVRW